MTDQAQMTAVDPGAGALAAWRQAVAAVLGPRRPDPGERAVGYGVTGTVIAVADQQPLAADNVWRVTLAEEACGRLVGRGHGGAWRLLQLDDLTDAQLDAYDAIWLNPLPAMLLATA